MSESNSAPETTVEITIQYQDIETAKSVLEAIAPDNLETPKEITIESRLERESLHLKVLCKKTLG
ncbi:MAG: hypothetical protein PVJ38_04065, partial [Candidatus Bathyarchaeota archaeon]